VQKAPANENVQVETPVNRPETVATNQQQVQAAPARPELQNAEAQNGEVVNPAAVAVLPEGAGNQEASVPSTPQPASTPPQARPAPSNDLFAQENTAVNPENIRDVNELVNSVVDNEFTSEAKKIFSEPKVIRTVADLADFILERLREIIIAKQQQPQSNSEIETF
jgi:hypothetical protein